MQKSFLAIGEAMIEMSAGTDGQWRMGFAGDTLNTAWYARALLGPSWTVGYLTRLGADRYSNAMRAFIEKSGIDTRHIGTVEDRRPGLYFIHQQDGDRRFTYWRDMAAARLLAEDRATLDAALSTAGMIYFSGITLAILSPAHRVTLLAALKAARARGATIVFDPNIRPRLWSDAAEMRDALTTAARVCDIVLPTFGDEKSLFGDADPAATADRYGGLGATEIVVKNGQEPAVAKWPGGAVEVPARPVAAVVDATGAGDSFNAGYLAARLEGRDHREALTAAHRIAATCLGHHGALAPRDAL
ncbi:sugar kinase [Mesorhizobium sp. YIM 152430]|uniref:sugar kinase n=1 Tax=Mesorhizobium sp. YIM 152430 TaxID=3031761 RepID=UPI0023DBA963|nr:sugar kinase [Mesorhizobium sp. YIM 152430]MDF1601800.1 sugar kinase [Mesorhizobium sp. YIM 152430]